jgi:hypothetical protein
MDIEARVAALEAALALPSASSGAAAAPTTAEAAALAERVKTLETQLARAQYRIKHLVRGLEAKTREAEQLRATGGSAAPAAGTA